MGYNVRLPLVFGELKIKSYSRLRAEERDRLVPVHKIGQTYYIWRSYSRSANPAEMANRNGNGSAVNTKVADRLH